MEVPFNDKYSAGEEVNVIDFFLYVKLCVNRAYSHFSMPVSVLNTTMLIAVLLKLNNVSMWTSACIGFGAFCFFLLLGYFDVKYGLFAREQSISNRYNPEMQQLLSRREK